VAATVSGCAVHTGGKLANFDCLVFKAEGEVSKRGDGLANNFPFKLKFFVYGIEMN